MSPTDAIHRGLGFLAASQLPSGQFPVQATLSYQPGAPVVEDSSPFATTHVVHSLGFLPHAEVRPMLDRALRSMRSEMSRAGLWRYWNRDAIWDGQRIHSFIPADLDDSASHSWLLRRSGFEVPDNVPLFLRNRDRRGLFYTWFVPRAVATVDLRYWRAILGELTLARMTVFWKTTEAAYDDVDAVVNANVLLYLGERSETRPVVDWLRGIIEAGCEATSDKWYRDVFTFHYAVSRCHHAGVAGFGALRSRIHDRLAAEARPDGWIGEHAMHTALAVSTLVNLGLESPLIGPAVERLRSAQEADGSWPSAPYYYGGARKAVSWGSRELTTGLCLEALHRAMPG